MASIADAALRIKGDPSALIDLAVVEAACRGAAHAWRDRTLGPVQMLEAFATQVAHGNTAISHLVRLCRNAFSEAAYCKARQRVPVDVFRVLLRAGSDALMRGDDASPAPPGTWNGHRTFLLDGSGCDMPDTAELQEHFGQSSRQKEGCGFPITNVLALFDSASRMLVDLVISPFSTNDLSRSPLLHGHLGEGDILVGDRGFGSYVHIALLQERKAHAVFRAATTRAIPFPALPGPREPRGNQRHRHERPELVELISEDDQIVELVKPHNRPKWQTPEEFARVPGKLRVRTVRYRVTRAGFRSKQIVLLTTLLDPVKYPAAQLAELYLSRWQVEVNLRDLKQTLGMNSLHCKTVDGVTKELLMFALVYNAVCAIMGVAARQQQVPVDRISFIDALRWLQLWNGETRVPTLKVNPRRTDRFYSRHIKRRSRYPKLQISRAKWRESLGKPP